MKAPSSTPQEPPTPEEIVDAASFLEQHLRPSVKQIFHHLELGFAGISEFDEFIFTTSFDNPVSNEEIEASRYRGPLFTIATMLGGASEVSSEALGEGPYHNVNYKICRFKIKIRIPRTRITSSLAQ